MIKSIVFKNDDIASLDGFLDIKLHGAQSRARTRVLRLIQPYGEEVNNERLAKLKELANKDDKGEPKMIGGVYDLTKENLKIFQDWFKELRNETVTLDVLPSNEQDWQQIRQILAEYPKELDALEAENLETILDALELCFNPKAKKAEVSHETEVTPQKGKKGKK